jgi:RsmE family RNA methyltransferase
VNVILLEPGDVSAAGDVRLTGPRAAHALTVLHVAIGQTLRVGTVDGPFGIGEVRDIAAGSIGLRCVFEPTVPERPRVDLLLALPRPKVMRRLWAQLAALGVDRVLLTNAARVERNYFDAHVLMPDRYRPLLIEGLQQARDTRLPRVSVHRRFKVLIEQELQHLCPPECRLVADPSAARSPRDAWQQSAASRVLLAIGPEGGWTGVERDLLAAHEFAPVGMGSRTLRTDTACVALIALVHDAMSSR